MIIKLIKRRIQQGISLKKLNFWLILLATGVSAMMIYSTYSLSASFANLSRSVNDHRSLEEDAKNLVAASDFLTENVQRYVVTGDTRFMDNYITEVLDTRRRENAVAHMSEFPEAAKALLKLKKSLNASNMLMEQEFYAMRLILSTRPDAPVPEILRNIKLKEEELRLSLPEKKHLAEMKVFSEDYYRQKETIRQGMSESLYEIHRIFDRDERISADSHYSEIARERWIIFIQVSVIFIMIFLTSHLGINPVLRAAAKIRANNPLQEETGATEFRYLARAYNQMYHQFQNSLDHLNYKASHDELTGAYNRSGYDLLLSAIDLSSTYVLLVDADDFKTINDTYGHDTGDQVLKKIVKTLSKNFRSDDYVCRIGGDEFVVFMVHADLGMQSLVESKAAHINRMLGDTSDGLPAISVSIGVTHGSAIADPRFLIKYADNALYRTKRKGKKGLTFFRLDDADFSGM